MKKQAILVFLLLLVINITIGCSPAIQDTNIPAANLSSRSANPTLQHVNPTTTLQKKIIIVTSSNDSGPGTLRQAMMDAENGDIIQFDPISFPSSTPTSIALTDSLPEITQGNLTIDGSEAGVILEGANILEMLTSGSGLSISSNGNIIRGLQIVNFPSTGIALFGGARDNTIGGDRNVGTAPIGQGNLVSGNRDQGIGLWNASYNFIIGNYVGTDVNGVGAWGNANGIHINGASFNQVVDNLVSSNYGNGIELCCTNDTHNNTISDNRVGTDISGKNSLGNLGSGVAIHDGANSNTLGPDNLIAYNAGNGVEVRGLDSTNNSITQNSIYDNNGVGIFLSEMGNNELGSPLIFDFDLYTGIVSGTSCAKCIVQVFSDGGNQGEIYEGQTTANSYGVFMYDNNAAFRNPHLTATATDIDGNTSDFSVSTSGFYMSSILQKGNKLQRTPLQVRHSSELTENRIGSLCHPPICPRNEENLNSEFFEYGLKGILRLSLNEIEGVSVDWSRPELSVDPADDSWITFVSNNITIAYTLSYWDKANLPTGWEGITSRFTTEQEVQNYLDYVRFIVTHFKDRIHYYEIWNEPDNRYPLQYIDPDDYIKLIRRTVPVIREIDPDAKIMVGGTTGLNNPDSQAYLFKILKSDIMAIVDVVTWHPFYGASPQYDAEKDYYYSYPSLVQQIKDLAFEHGFRGEFMADELTWRTPVNPLSDQPWIYSETIAAKYYARGIVSHLGMGVGVGIMLDPRERAINYIAAYLCSILDKAESNNLEIEILSNASNIASYAFNFPNGDVLFAVWTNGVAVDNDTGVSATLILPDLSGRKVTGIDILHGYEQELVTDTKDGNLVISDLIVMDYPIFIRLEP